MNIHSDLLFEYEFSMGAAGDRSSRSEAEVTDLQDVDGSVRRKGRRSGPIRRFAGAGTALAMPLAERKDAGPSQAADCSLVRLVNAESRFKVVNLLLPDGRSRTDEVTDQSVCINECADCSVGNR